MFWKQNRSIYLIWNLSKKNVRDNWDAFHLLFYFSTDVNSVVEEIVKKEPLITAAKVDKVKELIESKSFDWLILKI